MDGAEGFEPPRPAGWGTRLVGVGLKFPARCAIQTLRPGKAIGRHGGNPSPWLSILMCGLLPVAVRNDA